MKINESHIFFDIEGSDKATVIRNISKILKKNELVEDEEELFRGLCAREEEYSTGIQDGFAIPHAKITGINVPSVFYFKTKQSVEWDSLDGKPIDNLFVLVVPKENGSKTHLEAISNLAGMLIDDDFKCRISAATTAADIIDVMNSI